MAAAPSPTVCVEDLPDDQSSLGYSLNQPAQMSASPSTAMPGPQILDISGSAQPPGTMCVMGQAGRGQDVEVTKLLARISSMSLLSTDSPPTHDDRQTLIAARKFEVNAEEDTFVKLEWFREARTILRQNKFLLITGPPGSGKTSLAHGLMRTFRKKNMVAITVKSTQELTNLLTKENQILLMDDIFGKEFSDRNIVFEWGKHFTTIESQQMENKFIFTSRTDIYKQFQNTVRKYPIFKETNRVDLLELSPSDKRKLLQKHAEVAVAKGNLPPDHCLRGEMLKILSETRTPHGFPFCVQLFISLYYQVKDPQDFFRRPLRFLREDLASLWENKRAAFGALLLAVQNKGRLDQSLLDEYSLGERQELVRCVLRTVGISDNTTLHDITQASNDLKGTYFTEVSPDRKRELVLSHPSIYEAVLFVFGEKYPHHVPGLASLEFIINRVSICTLEDNSNCEKIILDVRHFDHLAVKFYMAILDRRFPMVATHPAFGCKEFIEVFQRMCEKEKDQGLLQALIARDEKYSMPLLYWSTWNKHGKLFKWVVRQLKQLTEKGTERDKEMAKGLLKMTPLRTAAIACCINGNKEALEFMFSISDSFRQTMIHRLGNYPGSLPVPSFEDFAFELPMDNREESTNIPHRQSLVHIAALHNNLNIISYLLDHCCAEANGGMKIKRGGAQQQDQDHQDPADRMQRVGRTPLHVAARYGHVDIVNKLIEKRADLLVPTEAEFGLRTPLHEACGAGHTEVVQTLIEALKEKNQLQEAQLKKAQFGHTPLHSAVYSKNPEVVQIILENGGDVKVCDDQNNNPLHLACEVPGNDEVLKVLLQFKADPVARNKDMNVPVHILCQKALDEKMLTTLLETKIATAHVFNKKRLTPLHMACKKKALKIIPVLLEHGAVINALDNDKREPIQMTRSERVRQILEDFVENSSAQAAAEDVNEKQSSPDNSAGQSP